MKMGRMKGGKEITHRDKRHGHAMTQLVVGMGGRTRGRPAEAARPKGGGGLGAAAERWLTGGLDFFRGVACSSAGLPGTGGSEISAGTAVALLSAKDCAELRLDLGGALAARGELDERTRAGDLALAEVRCCTGVDERFDAGPFFSSFGAGSVCFGGLFGAGGTGSAAKIGAETLGRGCGWDCCWG